MLLRRQEFDLESLIVMLEAGVPIEAVLDMIQTRLDCS